MFKLYKRKEKKWHKSNFSTSETFIEEKEENKQNYIQK